MSTIPNLNALSSGRRGPRLRGRRGPSHAGSEDAGRFNEEDVEIGKDRIIQQTDQDASSSRMSAVSSGYLDDPFARALFPAGEQVPKRYPIINRGTYVRTKAIDKLVAFAKKHGSTDQYKRALELLLPGSPVYEFLEGRIQSASITYTRLAEMTEKDEDQRIRKEISERRIQL